MKAIFNWFLTVSKDGSILFVEDYGNVGTVSFKLVEPQITITDEALVFKKSGVLYKCEFYKYSVKKAIKPVDLLVANKVISKAPTGTLALLYDMIANYGFTEAFKERHFTTADKEMVLQKYPNHASAIPNIDAILKQLPDIARKK